MIETVRKNDMAMRYFRFGEPGAQPMVIIPGVALKSVMESELMIKAQYKAFAEERNIYVFDRRENMPDNYTMYDMAEDTASAMELLSIKNADVYGVSQGGMIAQLIAARHQELVRRLVLCSTAPYIPEMSVKIFSKWMSVDHNSDMSKVMLSFAESIYTEKYFNKYHDAFIKYGEYITHEDMTRFHAMMGGLDDFDIRGELGNIKCPALVIAGGLDKLFGTEPSEEIAKLLDAEICIYPEEAHGVYDENEDVLRRIKDFLFSDQNVC